MTDALLHWLARGSGQVAPAAAVLALVAGALLRQAQTGPAGLRALPGAVVTGVALLPLAACIATTPLMRPDWVLLATGLALALLARDPRDTAQTEAALKLAWVLAVALALSWTGGALLSLAAGSARPLERWAVLALHLDPYAMWSSAFALSLTAGLVLLGGAPFHFWVADVFHGARAWLAPTIAAALMSLGVGELLGRLEGVRELPEAASLARTVLTGACVLAWLFGAATLATQRRPERRVGTLVSLNGALALSGLLAAHSPIAREPFAALVGDGWAAWTAHLVLAASAAGMLARFMPVNPRPTDPGAVLFRRHPWTAAVAGYGWLSLAGAPFTPGALLWWLVARALVESRHPGVLLALAVAWTTALAVAVGELRRAFGVRSELAPPRAPVAWPARAALWASSGGLLALGAAWLALRAHRG